MVQVWSLSATQSSIYSSLSFSQQRHDSQHFLCIPGVNSSTPGISAGERRETLIKYHQLLFFFHKSSLKCNFWCTCSMWGLLFSLTLSKSSLFTVIYFAFKYLTKAPLLLSDPSDGLCWDFCFHILLSLYQPLVHHLPCILFSSSKIAHFDLYFLLSHLWPFIVPKTPSSA